MSELKRFMIITLKRRQSADIMERIVLKVKYAIKDVMGASAFKSIIISFSFVNWIFDEQLLLLWEKYKSFTIVSKYI